MKKVLFIIILGIAIIASSDVYAVSLARGSKVHTTTEANPAFSSVKLDGVSTHVHIATSAAGVLLYELIVTPTSDGGFAQIFETRGDAADDNEYVKGKKTRLLADVQGATANGSIHVSWKNGIAASRLFIDTDHARAEVYYNE